MGRRDEEAPAGGTYPRQTCLSSRSFPPDWPGSLDVLPLPCPALPCPARTHSIPFPSGQQPILHTSSLAASSSPYHGQSHVSVRYDF